MSEPRPRKQFRPGQYAGRVNDITTRMARRGLIRRTSVLTTTGRRSGEARSMPVTAVEVGGRRYLVSPYGEVGWVHNVRADPRVTLARGRTSREFTVREVSALEAGPVLKRYVAVASVARPYFVADRRDPVGAFIAEAELHPVFELLDAG